MGEGSAGGQNIGRHCIFFFFIFLVARERYSSLQSDQGVWQVEAGVEVEHAGPFFGDRQSQGTLLVTHQWNGRSSKQQPGF